MKSFNSINHEKIIVLTFVIAVTYLAGCKKESVCDGPPEVNAGTDVIVTDQTSVILAGTTTAPESGMWSIISGSSWSDCQ